jgi:hypothetical protein
MQNMTNQLAAGTQVWFIVDGDVYSGVITGRYKDGAYAVDGINRDVDYYEMLSKSLRLSDLYETEAEARAAMQAAERSV